MNTTTEALDAFNLLISKLGENSMLAFLQKHRPYKNDTDASAN